MKILAGLRGRLGCGHSYDKVIRELVRRHIEETTSTILAGDRLKRMEAMLTQLLMQLEDKATASAQQKFTVQ
ncbi:MAG: hypothetical protein LV481_05270 [Methylacidiphilales bacterium]|nr:hypothetical protein [Candidatus Methylacidiphilales bacterium]